MLSQALGTANQTTEWVEDDVQLWVQDWRVRQHVGGENTIERMKTPFQIVGNLMQ